MYCSAPYTVPLDPSLIGQQNEPCDAVRPPVGPKEPPTAEAFLYMV